MNLNHKLECLKFISQVHRSQFNERRKYEWKIVLTTLSFYVFCVAAVYGGNFTLPNSWIFKGAVWIIFIPLAAIASGFLRLLHRANNLNKIFAERAENAIADILGNKTLFSCPDNYRVFQSSLFKKDIGGMWAWCWQTAMLFFFAIVSVILLTLK